MAWIAAACAYLWLLGMGMAYAIVYDEVAARFRRVRTFILVALWPLTLPTIMIVSCFRRWPARQGVGAK